MSRDSTDVSNDDNKSNGEQLTGINKTNLNETSTIVNGSTISDDAVVASSTLLNTDDSITAVDDQKSRDEWRNKDTLNKQSAIEEGRNIQF